MPRDSHQPPARPRPRRELDLPDAVCWHDGLPLAPQHFQESFRRVERLLDHHLGLAQPYHYGVVRLDLDRGRLSAGELSVQVEAVLPDRLVVRTRGEALTQRLDPAELGKKAKAAAKAGRRDTVGVYLAVPRERAGSAAAGEAARFHAVYGDHVKDDTTGDNEVEVPRLVPSARLVVDTEPPADAAWICLAELSVEGEAVARAEYQAPLLQVSVEAPLYALCARLVEHVRNTANRLAERLNLLSGSSDRDLVAEGRRQIYHLTAALPAFEAALFTGEAHPFTLYLALANLTGQLAPLSRSPVPPPLPPYRHDDLWATFAEIEARVLRVIREGIQESFRAYPFDAVAEGFRIDFAASWASKSVVLAVRQKHGGDEKAAARWLESAVIGPARAMRDLVASRALGVRREASARVDDLVPTSGEALYQLKNVGELIKGDEPLLVQNPGREADESRPMEMVLYVKKDPG